MLERRPAVTPTAAFLCVEDFEAPHPGPPVDVQTVVAERVYGDADLEAARRAGQESGEAAGRRAAALDTIAAELRAARARIAAISERRADEAARLMATALQTLLPDLAARHGPGEARGVCRFVLGGILDEPEVTIRVSEEVRDLVQAEVDGLDPDRAPHLVLIGDVTLAPGDVRITWGDGGAVRDSGAILAAARDLLARCGIEPPNPAEE